MRALQPAPLPSYKLLLHWLWVLGRILPTASPVSRYQELLLEVLESSCLQEQSTRTETPQHRTTCHVVFPEASFHFLNDLIDEPFLFIHHIQLVSTVTTKPGTQSLESFLSK